jgi:hypothetical protein
MSKITELASSRLNNSDALLIILSQPDDMPHSVIVHWPAMPTVIDPKAFQRRLMLRSGPSRLRM